MPTPEIYRYDGENPPVKVGGVSALLPALVPISYQDFMNLPQEEQESGSYIVTNMPTLMNAYSLGYKDGLSAGQKLDQLSSDLTELKTSKETTFTQIGTTGVFYRKINPFLVELKASLSQTINANTNYTLKAAGTLPADIRPAFNQTIFGSITASSGYVGGLAKIGVATDGSLVLTGSGVSGVGVSFADTYCLI